MKGSEDIRMEHSHAGGRGGGIFRGIMYSAASGCLRNTEEHGDANGERRVLDSDGDWDDEYSMGM